MGVSSDAADKYNAIVGVCFDEALAAARAVDARLQTGASDGVVRPLDGVPISVKESLEQVGCSGDASTQRPAPRGLHNAHTLCLLSFEHRKKQYRRGQRVLTTMPHRLVKQTMGIATGAA